MAYTPAFHDILDKPEWRHLAFSPNAHAAGGAICKDLRLSDAVGARLWQLVSATILNDYNVRTDGWSFTVSPALGGTFGAGACMIYKSCRGPRGTIAAGATIIRIGKAIFNK